MYKCGSAASRVERRDNVTADLRPDTFTGVAPSCRHVDTAPGPPAALPPVPLLPSNGDIFWEPDSHFCENMNFFATFFVGKILRKN